MSLRTVENVSRLPWPGPLAIVQMCSCRVRTACWSTCTSVAKWWWSCWHSCLRCLMATTRRATLWALPSKPPSNSWWDPFAAVLLLACAWVIVGYLKQSFESFCFCVSVFLLGIKFLCLFCGCVSVWNIWGGGGYVPDHNIVGENVCPEMSYLGILFLWTRWLWLGLRSDVIPSLWSAAVLSRFVAWAEEWMPYVIILVKVWLLCWRQSLGAGWRPISWQNPDLSLSLSLSVCLYLSLALSPFLQCAMSIFLL